ncbi:MAG: hypothetical protein KDD49_12150, partial [Bacteroidetes bacterium]|nr:hypothetical protein [Bacteroidota bacterium]
MRNLLLLLLGCFLSIATISAQSLTISQEKIKRSPYEQVEIGIAGFGINEDLSSNQTDYLEQFWIMYHLFVPVMKHISLGANY